MTLREYVWTDAGRSAAVSRKIGFGEVDQALHAPAGLRFEQRIGDSVLLVVGMADTGRVIAV